MGVSEMHLLPKFATITKSQYGALKRYLDRPLCGKIQFISLGAAAMPPKELCKRINPISDSLFHPLCVFGWSKLNLSLCYTKNTISCRGTLFFLFNVSQWCMWRALPKIQFQSFHSGNFSFLRHTTRRAEKNSPSLFCQ